MTKVTTYIFSKERQKPNQTKQNKNQIVNIYRKIHPSLNIIIIIISLIRAYRRRYSRSCGICGIQVKDNRQYPSSHSHVLRRQSHLRVPCWVCYCYTYTSIHIECVIHYFDMCINNHLNINVIIIYILAFPLYVCVDCLHFGEFDFII